MKATTEELIEDFEVKSLLKYEPDKAPKGAKYRLLIRIEDEYFAVDVLSGHFLGTEEEDVENLME